MDEDARTLAYVSKNINNFVRNCLFRIPEPVDEDQEIIEALFSFDRLDENLVPEIIERQNARLRFDFSLESDSSNLWRSMAFHGVPWRSMAFHGGA